MEGLKEYLDFSEKTLQTFRPKIIVFFWDKHTFGLNSMSRSLMGWDIGNFDGFSVYFMYVGWE